MIAEFRSKKQNGAPSFSAVCSALPNEPASKTGEIIFQPLFRGGAGGGKNEEDSGESSESCLAKQLEAIRIEKYHFGLEQGHREAARMARSEMVPVIQRLFAMCDSCADYQSEISSSTANHIIELGIKIAHQVMGLTPTFDSRKASELKEFAVGQMMEAYSLKIFIHPKLFLALQDLSKILQEPWPAYKTVAFDAHEMDSDEKIRVTIDESRHSELKKNILGVLTQHPEE
jgi:hypothetical protein